MATVKQPTELISSMRLERETKRTYVYEAVNPSAAVQTVYVQRSAYPNEAPKHLQLILRRPD